MSQQLLKIFLNLILVWKLLLHRAFLLSSHLLPELLKWQETAEKMMIHLLRKPIRWSWMQQDDFWFNYRMIMLLDREYEPDKEKRIEKAFRGIENEEDEALYESYVRGGVEVLYEKLMDGASSPEEYITKLYDFLEEFDERYNQTLSKEQVLELCRKAKA